MPGSSITLPSANLPTRILGPCRSAMMATSRPARWAAARTRVARSMWSWALPWLKLSRTTLTPARIIFSSNAASLEAGPRVATILVARRGIALLPQQLCQPVRAGRGDLLVLHGKHARNTDGADDVARMNDGHSALQGSDLRYCDQRRATARHRVFQRLARTLVAHRRPGLAQRNIDDRNLRPI